MASPVAKLLLLLGACNAVVSSAEQSIRMLSSLFDTSRAYRSTHASYASGTNASTMSDHPNLSIVLGVVVSAALFAAFIFIVDRETFDEVVGNKINCATVSCFRNSCKKPNIDEEDDGVILPDYITPETAEYLSDKHDEEVERPRRKMLAMYNFVRQKASNYLGTVQNFLPNSNEENFRIPLPDGVAKYVLPKKYDENSDEDKYQIRDLQEIPTDEQTLEDKVAYKLWHGKEEIQEKIEDIRLRIFWKPTKNWDEILDGKDKYKIEGEEIENEIQCNSWFEDDANTPWR